MAIPVTTPGEIRAQLVTLIEAMAPTYAEHQSLGWRYVADGDVSGPQIRRFTILNTPSQETFGGIHGGSGIEYDYEMTIRASYGGLRGVLADDLIDEDGKDLWLLLHPLPDVGGIDGLLPFRSGYQVEFYDDEPGALIVDFIFETHYKGRD